MSSSSSESEEEPKKVQKTQNDSDKNLLEIDLEKLEPLSKKQLRLLKKGKINKDKTGEVKASKKLRLVHASTDDLVEDANNSGSEGEKDGEKAKKTKSDFSVWIGNLSFDTKADDIRRFIVAKTAKYGDNKSAEDGEDEDEDEEDNSSKSNRNGSTKSKVVVTEKDITRIKLPLAPQRGGAPGDNRGGFKKIRGFAYVDLKTQEQVETVVGLSEEYLNGRNLLIKDSKSFEGRPAVVTSSGDDKGAALSKNPPSRILFVGNLGFDTTDDALETHFQHCGDIIKIRMATFEDSGNCKGFAFVDFKDIEGATEAIKDKSCRKMGGRFLRMEFGQDRSQRTKQEKHNTGDAPFTRRNVGERESSERSAVSSYPTPATDSYEDRPKRRHDSYKSQDRRTNDFSANKRLKPGLALATAQRAKTSILPSTGKKVVFD